MRVLVTGGCGFLGSHMVAKLVEASHDVVVVDDLWTGRTCNLERLLGPKWSEKLEFFNYDVSKPGLVKMFMREFDQIIHMASPASPPVYMSDPVRTMRANFVGALNLIELLVPGGRFCYTSTSEVYGDPEVSPLPETYRGKVDCTGPRSSYDESKRATEALLHELARTEGLQIRCSRIFNAYGPGTKADDGRCVSNFIVAALRGERLQVQGDGSQTRCFGFVTDIVEGLYQYFMHPAPNVPTVMNIGNDHEVTVLQVAEAICDLMGAEYEHVPPAPQDPCQRRPELSRSQEWLPLWNPYSVSLEDGLERTIEYFRQELKEGR